MTAEAPRAGRRPSTKPSNRSASLPLVEVLAVNVRVFRKRLRLTLRAASALAGLHWRQWQRLEAGKGNPTIETLARVAKGLGVELSALLRQQAGSGLSGAGGGRNQAQR